MEREDIIKRMATDYISPIIVAVRPDGRIRLCLDARILNEKMVGDFEQPPNIEEILSEIGDSSIFTALDLTNAFWAIELDKASQKYMGFIYEGQSFVFKRVAFGINTAGGTFNRALRQIIPPNIKNVIITYIDDILIHSKTMDHHLKIVDKTLKALSDGGAKINVKKCQWVVPEVSFVGHSLSQFLVTMTEETKNKILEFKRPTTKRRLQAFLGLANWDRRFISGLAEATRPMEQLLKKDVRFKWTEEMEKSFQLVKTKFLNAKSLFLLKKDWKYGIETDASTVGLGARLFQFNEDNNKEETIAYASRALKPVETKYTTVELEALSVIWSLNKWHVILYGRRILVRTDNIALTFLKSCKLTNARINRWIVDFMKYDIEWRHVRGTDNKTADFLSRLEDPMPSQIRSSVGVNTVLEVKENVKHWNQLRKDIIKHQRLDLGLQQFIASQPEKIIIEKDGLIKILESNHELTYVPNSISERVAVAIHQLLMHFGSEKMKTFAKSHMVIKNMDRIFRMVSKSCDLCQRSKYYNKRTEGKWAFQFPTRVNQVISLDLFGPLPITERGKKYIIVLMDQFSKKVSLTCISDRQSRRTIKTAGLW